MSFICESIKLSLFENFLRIEEKSKATVEKYLRDVRAFFDYTRKKQVDKSVVLSYKTLLKEKYAVASANSMLAALNAFFRFIGEHALCVKQFRMQKSAFCPAEKELSREEYRRLVATAAEKGNERLSLVMQTICGTGIRISELPFVTVEAVRQGQATVACKGKCRQIFFVSALRKKLLHYAKHQKITAGPIFVSKNGKPLNRSNVWKEMKALCAAAGVSPTKVFPHNLRHLFARVFYGLEKDIVKLADILGHTSINTTRIYIISSGEAHRRSMEAMRLIL